MLQERIRRRFSGPSRQQSKDTRKAPALSIAFFRQVAALHLVGLALFGCDWAPWTTRNNPPRGPENAMLATSREPSSAGQPDYVSTSVPSSLAGQNTDAIGLSGVQPGVSPPTTAQPEKASFVHQAVALVSKEPPTATDTQSVAAADDESAKLREIYNQAVQRYARVRDYVCRFRRREVLAKSKVSEDMVLLQVRKEPFSLRLTWPKGSPEEGREVIYVAGRFNDQLVVRTGKGDLLSGLRIELAPDSPRARANTRRNLVEAHVGHLVKSLGQAIQEQERGTYGLGRIRYFGRQQRPESATPLEVILQDIPPGLEKYLPHGGKRYFYLATDSRLPEFGLPVLVITHEDAGREVEYYCFDRFNINIGLRDEDFDPDVLWGKK